MMNTRPGHWLASLEPPAIGGLLLMLSALVAFVWANSPAAGSYEALWQIEFGIGAGAYSVHKPLILWINDGLMAVFFLLVGLEIKRELLDGALSTRRKASLPFLAAIGGIAVPALIYSLINLTAVAVVDDLGAILIIAIFFSESVHFGRWQEPRDRGLSWRPCSICADRL